MKNLISIITLVLLFAGTSFAQTVSIGYQNKAVQTHLLGKMPAVESFDFKIAFPIQIVEGFDYYPSVSINAISHNDVEQSDDLRQDFTTTDSRRGNMGINVSPIGFHSRGTAYGLFQIGFVSYIEPLGGDFGSRFSTTTTIEAGWANFFDTKFDIGLRYYHVFNGNNAEISLGNLDSTMLVFSYKI